MEQPKFMSSLCDLEAVSYLTSVCIGHLKLELMLLEKEILFFSRLCELIIV